jgi:hypothetical protein
MREVSVGEEFEDIALAYLWARNLVKILRQLRRPLAKAIIYVWFFSLGRYK